MSIYQDRRLLIPFRSTLLPQIFTDVLVIGTGVAGLRTALGAAAHGDVIILAKEAVDLSNTSWAQGGIASVLDARDTVASHVHDTLEAGAGLCEPDAVRTLVEGGPAEIRALLEWGMRLDKAADGTPALGLEGGHRAARIVHTDGDATGHELARCLIERVRQTRGIRVFDRCFAIDLLRTGGAAPRALGAVTWHPRHGLQIIWARATVLASGGAGQVFRETTNPRVATGDGLAMAWRAGAELADLEFMQFHPTALYVAGAGRLLISEAVRGEGAHLVDRKGERFMLPHHPMAELAPRDVVSKCIVRHLAGTGESHVFLDCRHFAKGAFAARFPGLARMLAGFDLDPEKDLVPVTPAAHYTIGGVRTDLDGRSSVAGLYACGEAAACGVHGANRLASNSLLEGLVFGTRVAGAILRDAPPEVLPRSMVSDVRTSEHGELDLSDIRSSLRSAMWRNVGIERTGTRLSDVLQMYGFWGRYGMDAVFDTPEGWETQNLLTTGLLMTRAALARRESRGTHQRVDFPATDPAQEHHLCWQIDRRDPILRRVGQLASAALAVLLAVVPACAMLAGCATDRTEYRYRPAYMSDPNAPKETTLADGTHVVWVDSPVGPSTIDRDRIKNPKEKPVKLGPDGKPLPVKVFQPREQEDDGKVVLRNIMPEHVVANAMECFRNEEYQLMWDQLLAPDTRTAYQQMGGYNAFEEWCRANRRPTMELLNRMRFNAMGSDVVMDKISPTRMRAHLSPHLWEQFRLHVVEFEMTSDGMKLVSIK